MFFWENIFVVIVYLRKCSWKMFIGEMFIVENVYFQKCFF